MQQTSFKNALVAAALLTLSACGDKPAEGLDAAAQTAQAHAAAARAAKGQDADLVKAASPGKPGAPVDMKFKLGSKPEVGKPVELLLAFSTSQDDLDRMTVSLQASSGLTIESGEGPATFVPSVGSSISHRMVVKAERDGIFYVTAIVLVDTKANTSRSRTFSVPIIVGTGVTEALAKSKAGLSTDSKGQTVKSMPAAEPQPTR